MIGDDTFGYVGSNNMQTKTEIMKTQFCTIFLFQSEKDLTKIKGRFAKVEQKVIK